MKVNIDTIEAEFNLHPFGAKGWKSNKEIICPYCSRVGKYGFMLKNDSGVTHCFYCSDSKPIHRYLSDIGRKDLLTYEKQRSIKTKLNSLTREPDHHQEESLFKVKLPRGLVALKSDEYLDRRGFTPKHYETLVPSYTEHFLERELWGYMIFQIFQSGELVSWLARSRNSYEWHKENLRQYKDEGVNLKLRYMNSPGTKFELILGGYDEITDETHTVIICEGLFDKVNVDKLLGLHLSPDIKCVFSFGNSLTENQINLLRVKESVTTTILMYDQNAVLQRREYGMKLNQYFETFIASWDGDNIDPGDFTPSIINSVIDNLSSPTEYYSSLVRPIL